MNEQPIFDAARAIPAGPERESYLDQACSQDPDLRQRVSELLSADENPDSFLDDPAARALDPAATSETVIGELDRDGQQVGPYKLLQQIGEGGMGVVFMAEQVVPVKRRVALKIIKPGMDTREVIARFEAERQALAMMDHPNIARVLDAGTTSGGRPYFVMELVNGLPITEYCDEHNLPTAERLRLFGSVCRGVQHAHHKGIIHRDLKPSNILVAEYDQNAVPKVIDFGVAKATNQQLTEKTLFTQFGQIVGTLDYMSPEQAKRNQLDVDTRSDVYSLGVVLYELLTGVTPFDKQRLREAAFDEMLRIIREEDPPPPSYKLSTSDELPAVARNRGADPARLPAAIRGDLDWIVLRTLEKDRTRRYATPQDLGDDILRHLQDLPVLAGPPRLRTRLTKFARRNRWPLAITTLVVAALLTTGLWKWASVSGHSERTSAAIEAASLALGQAIESPISSDLEWSAANATLQRVTDLLAEGSVFPKVRSRAEILLERADAAQTERNIAERLEDVLITSASHPDLESWVRMERRLRRLFIDNGLNLDTEDPMVIARRIREHQFSNRFSDILELWIGTRAQISMLGGPPATAENMQPWAEAMFACDDDPLRTGIRKLMYSGVPHTYQQVIDLVETADLDTATPRTLAWLAHVYAGARDGGARAIRECDRIFRIANRRYPGDVMLNFDYGFALARQERWPEAARWYARALALRPDAAGLWQMQGIALENANELENASRSFARACEIAPRYGPSWVNYGNVLLKQHRSTEAADAGAHAIETMPQHPAGYGVVGRAHMQAGDYDKALPLLEKCHKLAAELDRWTEPSEEWLAECRRALKDTR